jgi:hypothetical protein
LKKTRAQLDADMGYKPLNKFWAKVEILLGLLGVGLGFMALQFWLVLGQARSTDSLRPLRKQVLNKLIIKKGFLL